ncbi:MAG: hypothetical protein MK160_10825 [Rhodobacteraceae bacterium]|nr:hypothetical protein [Paracoccaceae bacterium]
MKHFALPVLLALVLGTPAAAEDTDENGFSLMEEGARLFMQGIMREIEPALDEMEDFAREVEPSLRSFARSMGPALQDLLAKVDDWTLYHPPELLENGDIIIRRKQPAEDLAEPKNEVDL